MRDVFLRYTRADGQQYCDVAPDIKNVEKFLEHERAELDEGWSIEQLTESEYDADPRRIFGNKTSSVEPMVLRIESAAQPLNALQVNFLGDPIEARYNLRLVDARIDARLHSDCNDVRLGRCVPPFLETIAEHKGHHVSDWIRIEAVDTITRIPE
jgi:hypothetical protein